MISPRVGLDNFKESFEADSQRLTNMSIQVCILVIHYEKYLLSRETYDHIRFDKLIKIVQRIEEY